MRLDEILKRFGNLTTDDIRKLMLVNDEDVGLEKLVDAFHTLLELADMNDRLTKLERSVASLKAQPRKSPGKYSKDFETFWQLFPPLRRTKKPGAWKAWCSQGCEDCSEDVLRGVMEFAKSERGRGKFCPGPEPWLNQRTWEEDPSSWGANRDKSKSSLFGAIR